MIDPVLSHLERDADAAVERLKAFVAIPSVSTDTAYAGEVERAARWIGDRLTTIGLETVVQPTAGHPIVIARGGDPACRTHLIYYGHYDVQPPDPTERWTTDPFTPVVEGGALRGRGTSDDKGQVSCFVEAIGAWIAVHQRLPVRVTVLLEGEEECGSANLPRYLDGHADALRHPDDDAVVVISDTTMWPGDEGDRVAITYGLRGNLYYDIQLHGPSRDLHSGVFGGTVPNPATLLTAVLGRLFDTDRRVTVPGFYDDVAEVSDGERQRWSTLGFDASRFLGAVGIETPVGESGFDTLARRWARPSCDICGLYGGYGGEGAKTVIPSFAGAKVGFRLAPHQNPPRIAEAFEAWLRAFDVLGCRWQITHLGHADPVVMPLDSPFIAAAGRAVRRVAGHEPVLVREGATIPILADFKRALGLDSLLLGFGREDDCIHAPNEKFDLDCFRTGCRTHAALIGEVAGTCSRSG